VYGRDRRDEFGHVYDSTEGWAVSSRSNDPPPAPWERVSLLGARGRPAMRRIGPRVAALAVAVGLSPSPRHGVHRVAPRPFAVAVTGAVSAGTRSASGSLSVHQEGSARRHHQ
jgi:hypothetical protein